MGGFKILKSGTAIKAEFVAIFGSMRAALIGNVRLGWKQIHQSKGSQHWIHSQMAAITRTQRPFFFPPTNISFKQMFSIKLEREENTITKDGGKTTADRGDFYLANDSLTP